MKKSIFILLIFTIFSFEINNHPINFDEICKGISNSYECAKAIEKYQLNNESFYFNRKNDSLILKLESNKTIALIDTNQGTPNCVLYNYRQFFKKIGVYIIHIQFYEGEKYMIVSSKSGQSVIINNLPVFSPDTSRFVSYNLGIGSLISENVVEVWKMNDNKFILEFKLDTMKNWGPYMVEWKSKSKLNIVKAGLNSKGDSLLIYKDTLLIDLLEKK